MENVEKENRVVTMHNGETVNFGTRDNVKTSIGLETNTIEFRLISGHDLSFSPFTSPFYEGCSSLPEIPRTVLLYGILGKIKTNVAALKPVVTEVSATGEETTSYPLRDGIVLQIQHILNGKFNVRGVSSEEDVYPLTNDEQAYALTWIQNPEAFSEPQNSPNVEWSEESFSNPEVIADIREAWDKKSRSTKAAYRKHSAFITNLAFIRAKSGKEVKLT